jgi:hypothetical protein
MVGITNATCVADLKGPFKTYSFNAAWYEKALGLQLSIGKNCAGRKTFSFSYSGPLGFPSRGGFGIAVSAYNTNIATTGK